MGLGNPGRNYQATRHNVGARALDRALQDAEVMSAGTWKAGSLSLAGYHGGYFLALKPATFMNNSGQAVAPVKKRYRLTPERIVVLHDDIDIPMGEVRWKTGGGSGGHRGVASIAEEIDDGGFVRLRIGVGRPPEGTDPAEYVLSRFDPGEKEDVEASISEASARALDLLRGGT